MKTKMKAMRRALARLILVIDLPTIVYVLFKMGDPEYLPSPGWTVGFLTLVLATAWGCQYSEITYRR